jgi:hypothetical protein
MDGSNPDFFKRRRLRPGLAPTPFAAPAVAVLARGAGARAGNNLEPLGENKIRTTHYRQGYHGRRKLPVALAPDGAFIGVEFGSRAFDCNDVCLAGENTSLRLKPEDDTFVGSSKSTKPTEYISTNGPVQQALRRRTSSCVSYSRC